MSGKVFILGNKNKEEIVWRLQKESFELKKSYDGGKLRIIEIKT